MSTEVPRVPRYDATVFMVHGQDDPGRKALRVEHLDGHLAHVERHWDRYLVAGPVRPGPGKDITGSVLMVIAESEAEARALCDADPYFSSGLFETVTVQAFTPALGTALGGVTWESAEAVRAYAVSARPAG